MMGKRFDPADCAFRLGTSLTPRGCKLWVPLDRSVSAIGIPGTGKTQCVLAPALLNAPGAAMFATTKAADMYLTIPGRQSRGRPVLVLDPAGMAPGLPELVWDPVAGCLDSRVAEKRALAFARGTLGTDGGNDVAQHYTDLAATVLRCFLHAAALSARTLVDVLRWIATPSLEEAEQILARHPGAAPNWHAHLHGALNGDPRAVGNTLSTVNRAVAVFNHADVVARCIPRPGRPATDLAAVILAGGTFYLLGKDDAYSSTTPLLTAAAEEILDLAEAMASQSTYRGRLVPPFAAIIDELPTVAPIPSLPQRLGDGRGRGIWVMYAAQAWRQISNRYGRDVAISMSGITNVLVIYGGGKDVQFNTEMSQLIGTLRRERSSISYGHDGRRSISTSRHREAIMEPHEIGRIPKGQALVLSDVCPPLIARTPRLIDGRRGREVMAAAEDLHSKVRAAQAAAVTPAHAQALARAQAIEAGFAPPDLLIDAAELHAGPSA